MSVRYNGGRKNFVYHVLVNMIKIYMILDLWTTSIISNNNFKFLHKLILLELMKFFKHF
jgi:hypothetical protein